MLLRLQVRFAAAMIPMVCAVCVAVSAGGSIASSLSDTAADHREYNKRDLQIVGQIQALRLINADTDLPIVDLVDGMVINTATLSTSNFNVQATVTNNAIVQSVKFGYNTRSSFRIESEQPYAICGDGGPVGNYNVCLTLVVGQHNLSATPYTGTKASGTAGPTKHISFRIVNKPPTAAPTCNKPQVMCDKKRLFDL
jgi:hypothetical protein